MTDALTPGPLSQAEIFALWQATVDERFAQPLVEQGDGYGLEVYGQAFAQFARVSKAIDVTMESMYVTTLCPVTSHRRVWKPPLPPFSWFGSPLASWGYSTPTG